MINTTKIGNNLEARYEELFEDPVKWGIMRNLAYASIRDDIEKLIKHTNENSADVFINAENLVQNLKGNKINQYIEAGKLNQIINLGDLNQLNQVLMNTEIFSQTINVITKQQILLIEDEIQKLTKSSLTTFFNNKYAIITFIEGDPKKGKKDEIYSNSYHNLDQVKAHVHKFIVKYEKTEEYPELIHSSKNKISKYKTSQYINKTQENIFDTQRTHAIYEVRYNENKQDVIGLDDKSIIFIILNLEHYKLMNEKTDRTLTGNILGNLIGNREKLSEFIGSDVSEIDYNKGLGAIVKNVEIVDLKYDNSSLERGRLKDILFPTPKEKKLLKKESNTPELKIIEFEKNEPPKNKLFKSSTRKKQLTRQKSTVFTDKGKEEIEEEPKTNPKKTVKELLFRKNK